MTRVRSGRSWKLDRIAGENIQSVMLFEPATSNIAIHQYLERPLRPSPASAR